MTEKKPRNDYGIDQKTFIWAWESSDTIEECHQKLVEYSTRLNQPVMSKPIVAARAHDYRSQGINLKKYKPGRKPQQRAAVQDLNDYIAELRSQKEAGTAPPPPKEAVEATPLAAIPPAVLEEAKRQLLEQLLAGEKIDFPKKKSK